jgi:hypothetical protein
MRIAAFHLISSGNPILRIFGPILLGYPKAGTPRPPKKEPKVKWV